MAEPLVFKAPSPPLPSTLATPQSLSGDCRAVSGETNITTVGSVHANVKGHPKQPALQMVSSALRITLKHKQQTQWETTSCALIPESFYNLLQDKSKDLNGALYRFQKPLCCRQDITFVTVITQVTKGRVFCFTDGTGDPSPVGCPRAGRPAHSPRGRADGRQVRVLVGGLCIFLARCLCRAPGNVQLGCLLPYY